MNMHIDIDTNRRFGWKDCREDAHARAFRIMQQSFGTIYTLREGRWVERSYLGALHAKYLGLAFYRRQRRG